MSRRCDAATMALCVACCKPREASAEYSGIGGCGWHILLAVHSKRAGRREHREAHDVHDRPSAPNRSRQGADAFETRGGAGNDAHDRSHESHLQGHSRQRGLPHLEV
eukprot:scaffold964_cov261-Pinguiococcus_pyrenoidosus.AAC.18